MLSNERPIVPPHYCLQTRTVPLRGRRGIAGATEGAVRRRAIRGENHLACALWPRAREGRRCLPSRRRVKICWPCRTGLSWSATTASSASWAPAGSASPTLPTRRRWLASSPSRNTFPPISLRARTAAPRLARSEVARRLPMGPRPVHRGGADARPLRSPQHRARAPLLPRQQHRLHGAAFRGGRQLQGLAEGPQARAAPGRAGRNDCAAARCAGDHPQGQLPAPRYRARQHHGAQGRLAGADRLRIGARPDRVALADGQRAGEARLQPLRAVCHHQQQPGTVDRHLCARRHALSCHHRASARPMLRRALSATNMSARPRRRLAPIAADF